jgi:hypothetical protein
MHETIPVEEALKKGQRMVNWPIPFILLSTNAIGFFSFLYLFSPLWVVYLFFILSIIFSWLYWSIMITKWRIWAFTNVRNIHELKKKAEWNGLIWKKGSFFEKTEIKTNQQKKQLIALEAKFNQPDLIIENHDFLSETVVYFSKKTSIITFIDSGLLFIYSIGACIYHEYLLAIICLILGIYPMFDAFKRYFNRNPQITLNNKGIWTTKTGFQKWQDIEDEEVLNVFDGESSEYFLSFIYGEKEKLFSKISILNLDITPEKLESLLRIYRWRYSNLK